MNIKELSEPNLRDYVKKAVSSADELAAQGDTKKADKRNRAIDYFKQLGENDSATKIIDKERVKELLAKKKELQNLLLSSKKIDPAIRVKVAQGLASLNTQLEKYGIAEGTDELPTPQQMDFLRKLRDAVTSQSTTPAPAPATKGPQPILAPKKMPEAGVVFGPGSYPDVDHIPGSTVSSADTNKEYKFKVTPVLTDIGKKRLAGKTPKQIVNATSKAHAKNKTIKYFTDELGLKPHVDFDGLIAVRVEEGVAEGSDKLQGTPVVSLSDLTDKDYKKNKYGQTVPKKLKKDDPRVKFHKDEKQGVAEGHADQQRKIFKKNGKPVGEVGIDRESSPGAGQWYMKCYAYNIDNSGYDSYEEAVAELKHCLKQGVAEGKEQISIKVKKAPNKFATELQVDGKTAGVCQYDANTGRSIAEVYPEFKGKGYGKILVLHAIYTAAKLGMDFVEDESRTSEYDNVLDSLSNSGYIVDDDGYWYVTGEGEQFLKQSLKQGVAETNVSKYKDLGATKDTVVFVKNMTTGKIVSPHRSIQDAKDAIIALQRNDDDVYKIVRARKEGVAEGAKYLGDRRKYFALRNKSIQELDKIINSDKSTAGDKELAKRAKAEKKKKDLKENVVNENYNEIKDTVTRAISHRIMHQHLDLIRDYGIDAVMNAIDDKAEFVASTGDLEEISPGDVSTWVNSIRRHLNNYGEKKNVDENPTQLKEVDSVGGDQLEEYLNEAEEHLRQAINFLRMAAVKGRRAPHPFSGQLEAYIIPHLKNWIENDNQPGSITSLKRILYNEY
jgi:GNAT superfamily N-acetyltransferase